MRKSMKAIWKSFKKNDVGFTMIELIVAIAILGVVSATVAYVMFSSSKSYRSMSIETQLQSETQLVANAISELAVDSYDASSKLDGLDIEGAYNKGDREVLLLNSKVDGKIKQYVIALKGADKELYLAERDFDEADNSWNKNKLVDSDFSLLGDNIKSFSVDDSRVEKDNILLFKLTYERDGRVYEGNFQILMRNKAYADQETVTEDNTSTTLVLGLEPKVVYLDVVNETDSDGKIVGADVEYYYTKSVSAANQRTAVNGVEFRSTAISNRSLMDDGVTWEINGGDGVFYMSNGTAQEEGTAQEQGAGQAVDNILRWKKDLLADFEPDSFSITINKSIPNPDGTGTIDAQEKIAQVMLRRVRKITLNPSAGATQWLNVYDEVAKPNTGDGVSCYAYPDIKGDYVPMTVNASITQSNVAYGGGLKWKLEKKDTEGNWSSCEKYAQLSTTDSDTNTFTTIKFSDFAENGQVYRVVATSKFDSTVAGELIFGIAPTGTGSSSGFNSRGFYVDMTSYVKSVSDNYKNVSISMMRIDRNALNGIFSKESDIRLEQGTDKRWYLYVSYDAYAGSVKDKSKFYDEDSAKSEIPIYITRTDTGLEDPNPIKYTINPVYMGKVSPNNDVIVLTKGKDKTIKVQTEYYNLIGEKYFGIYLDDMDNSISPRGLWDSHPYIKVNITSAWGDLHNYVNQAEVTLTAKSNMRDYNPKPMTLRLTADDYYVTSGQKDINSYKDYTVYIANVKDMDVFIPTPDSPTWPDKVQEGEKSANVYTAAGTLDYGAAKVYVQGNKYRCDYMGSTYTYNKTYHYWNK